MLVCLVYVVILFNSVRIMCIIPLVFLIIETNGSCFDYKIIKCFNIFLLSYFYTMMIEYCDFVSGFISEV